MFKFVSKSILLLSLFGIVYGFIIPNYEGYVTDKVGVFSETQKADLNAKIQEIEQATSIEIAVLVVPTVDDDINLAAVDVGNQWGVGKKGQNNGLVILIAVDDRKWSIQVGYGLEGILPDLATKQIGEVRFPPNFKEGNYYQGVMEMLDDALGYIKQDATIVQTYSQNTTTSNSSNDNYIEFVFLIIFFGISIFGRLLTVPTIKGKRKMRKYGRWIYAASGLIISFLLSLFFGLFILFIMSTYLLLGLSIFMALVQKQGSGGIRFGGGGNSFGGGGSGFGGFGGGGFGGGGSSGSR